MANMKKDEAREQFERHQKGLLLTHRIDSTRTARLIDEVWERIPEEDREVLRKSVRTTVVEGPGLRLYDPDVLFDAVSRLAGAVQFDGVESVLPWRTVAFLNSDVLSKCNDDAAKAMIARQLAHVVLRHPSMIYPLALRYDSGWELDGLLQKVAELHQWEADLQA